MEKKSAKSRALENAKRGTRRAPAEPSGMAGKKPYAIKGDRSRFDPEADTPYRVSRSGIDRFLECPRCFYLEKRLGIARPDSPGFALNTAVDALLKREFDDYRARHATHPLMKKYGIDAVPYDHPDIEIWRDSLRRGISILHEPSELVVRGGVDDVWITPDGTLLIVDYKATSKSDTPSIDDAWYRQGYKRQMEVYQWLFRQNGFKVSDTGYFVYTNGDSGREAFNDTLAFETIIIPYKGDDGWVDRTVTEMAKVLRSNKIPASDPLCHFCGYVRARNDVEL